MAEINKPSDINKIWAAGGDIVTPADTKINNGWVEEIPPHEYENYIQNKQDLSIAHINQHGIAIWDSVTEYQANRSLVQGSNGRIYKAATTNTNVNPTTDSSGAWYDINESNMVVFSTPGVYTWTVPATLKSGFKRPKVTVTGGGGSGGSGDTSNRGAGGGAGGTAIGTVNLSGVNTVTITVGSGGGRKTSAVANGENGSQSSFGTYLVGQGGNLGQRSAASSNVAGGLGGSASGGALNLKGGDGSDGPNATAGGGSGDGGASFWGGGIRSGTGTSSNTVNNTPGSGGGSGTLVSSPGGHGIVVIEW